MKTLRLILLWLYCLAYMALAERTLTLAWNANPATDLVTGYAVIVDGRELPPVTGTTASVTIPDAKTVVSVIAINIAGKSLPSDPIVIPAAPSNPKGVTIKEIRRTTISTP